MPAASAGGETAAGEIGPRLLPGPQTFSAMSTIPEATAATLSARRLALHRRHGRWTSDGLHFSGRAKWVLKPAGYQVFPGRRGEPFQRAGRPGGECRRGGTRAPLWSEGIVAFVESAPGADLSEAELRKHARVADRLHAPAALRDSGTRRDAAEPQRESGRGRLQELARDEVAKLRERGRWDG